MTDDQMKDTPADAAAAAGGNAQTPQNAQNPTPDSGSGEKLNGNDSVNQAAEAWKDAASRNIPPVGLDPTPIDDDTANLRQGPSLNDALLGLLPLVGVWQGEGQGFDENDEQYAFGQQLIIAHDGGEYLTYTSRTWRLDENGNSQGATIRETGFWRISPKDEIEMTYTSSTGIVEIFYGEPYNERAWQLESASTMVTETGPKKLGPGRRMYGLMPNNDLGWVDERMGDGELKPNMSAQLKRIAG